MAKASRSTASRSTAAGGTRPIKQRQARRGGMIAVCIGLALIGLGVFMGFSFATADVGVDIDASAETCWTGLLGAWIAFGGIFTLGKASALLLAVLLACWGLHIARNARFLTTWPAVFGGVLILAGFSLGVCAIGERYDMNTGGLLAVYVSPPAILYFGRWGLILASTGIVILGILLAFGEAAIAFVHQTIFAVRDIAFGALGLGARLRDMFRLLFNPRLAVANGAPAKAAAVAAAPVARETITKSRRGGETAKSGSRTVEKEADDVQSRSASLAEMSAEETRAMDEDDDSSVVFQPPVDAPPAGKEWQPKESFHSRFLNLDPTGDIPTMQPPMQSVDEAVDVNVGVATRVLKRPPADVIMDVEALTEESDQMTDESASDMSDIMADIRPEVKTERIERPEPPAPKPVTPFTPPTIAPRPSVQQQVRETPVRPVRPETGDTESRAKKEAVPGKSGMENYQLPPLEMLDPPQPPVVEDTGVIQAKAKILEQTLSEFKIEGRVVHIERGPRVTMYEISLAPGIRLSKVTSLADNIAMQLQAESVRIIAPIPGKNTIGIEIPNECKELVSLYEIVDAVNREKRRQALPVCLGKDVSGQALVADLARMPHLLIAGATGSGKSVCINSIILSVMMCCRPDEAQMILVDPKVVELSRFKDIPHLMSPVITDMKRAVSVLDWICQKMDERYEQMSQVSVNNIAKFNALGDAGIRERLDEFASLEEIEMFPKSMPYMVVIIDELADLMMVAGKEVEHHITRLAAKSRAVGIHLILATQRPSVDVITGLIKANMPCRIAFQVASRVDSRTILDGNGAETLLGQGDMLYLPPGVGKLTRAQGVFVSDEELFRVVDFVKAEAGPQYHEDLLGPVIGGNGGKVDVSSFDELFIQSGAAIIENQRGSVSLLQRKFGIGYGRASRIIDQLASVGLLGPFRDGKARQILLTMEEFHAKFGIEGDWSADDEDDAGSLAGLRDDERERDQPDWGSDIEDD